MSVERHNSALSGDAPAGPTVASVGRDDGAASVGEHLSSPRGSEPDGRDDDKLGALDALTVGTRPTIEGSDGLFSGPVTHEEVMAAIGRRAHLKAIHTAIKAREEGFSVAGLPAIPTDGADDFDTLDDACVEQIFDARSRGNADEIYRVTRACLWRGMIPDVRAVTSPGGLGVVAYLYLILHEDKLVVDDAVSVGDMFDRRFFDLFHIYGANFDMPDKRAMTFLLWVADTLSAHRPAFTSPEEYGALADHLDRTQTYQDRVAGPVMKAMLDAGVNPNALLPANALVAPTDYDGLGASAVEADGPCQHTVRVMVERYPLCVQALVTHPAFDPNYIDDDGIPAYFEILRGGALEAADLPDDCYTNAVDALLAMPADRIAFCLSTIDGAGKRINCLSMLVERGLDKPRAMEYVCAMIARGADTRVLPADMMRPYREQIAAAQAEARGDEASVARRARCLPLPSCRLLCRRRVAPAPSPVSVSAPTLVVERAAATAATGQLGASPLFVRRARRHGLAPDMTSGYSGDAESDGGGSEVEGGRHAAASTVGFST